MSGYVSPFHDEDERPLDQSLAEFKDPKWLEKKLSAQRAESARRAAVESTPEFAAAEFSRAESVIEEARKRFAPFAVGANWDYAQFPAAVEGISDELKNSAGTLEDSRLAISSVNTITRAVRFNPDIAEARRMALWTLVKYAPEPPAPKPQPDRAAIIDHAAKLPPAKRARYLASKGVAP